jgi:heparan-alpha-glucosaminide N-acetyltransferase
MVKRILTIDIMRGLTLFLMLFVNDLYMKNVPWWLGHTEANFDGMGLADWVFPGFLFMVGMAVPFAVQSRLNKGHKSVAIVGHIFLRTFSLIVIGILMLNISRLNPELAGISKNLWAIFMYVSVFLIWNMYGNLPRWLIYSLRGAGFAGLLVLVYIFRSGTAENPGWLVTGWWGILGLIGWGYFATALVYMAARENLWKTGLFWLLFLALNILSQVGMLSFLKPLRPLFGVLISGNTPLLVVSGLLFSLVLRKTGALQWKKFTITATVLGVLVLASGFILRNWFIISKIKATPSWGLICTGISILLFVLLFLIIDVAGKTTWTKVFKPAGQNSLTTYLAPDIIYYSVWMTGFPLFFYKHLQSPLLVIAGSLVWAFAMIGFAALLARIGIRLKL